MNNLPCSSLTTSVSRVKLYTFETVWSLSCLQTVVVPSLVKSNSITSSLYMYTYIYIYIERERERERSKTFMLSWSALCWIQEVGSPLHLICVQCSVLPSLSVESKL